MCNNSYSLLSLADVVKFPTELKQYGLNEVILQELFLKSVSGLDLQWALKEVPTIAFYRELHNFLKNCPVSNGETKTTIGKFYIAIDPNLYRKSLSSGRPDNIYQFIEKVAVSRKPDSAIMSYGLQNTIQHLSSEVSTCSSHIKELSEKLSERDVEISAMRKEIEIAREELDSTRHALKDITNKLSIAHKQRDCAQRQVHKTREKLETTVADHVYFEDELLAKNGELTEVVRALQQEITTLPASAIALFSTVDHSDKLVNFCFQTQEGHKTYSPAIRELYYSLLGNQLSPSKIATIIRTVLKCFLPSVDLKQLKLPSESCASYMRRQELTTINMVHKAQSILEQAEHGSLHLNTDGTTKSQKKLEGVAINGMVVSVNEVSDGSADCMIEDISRELEMLREVAHALSMPNADKLNWTLIVSSSSDSASTQKRFNKLVEEQREEDEKKFGASCPEVIDLVENFCCMHLGVNLRKAFLSGTRSLNPPDSSAQQREHHQVDTLVHEFCKLFGRSGVPEYGCGTLAFPDYLKLAMEGEHFPEKRDYYSLCAKVKLDRQVGSRYFVTASNAGKVLFLQEAALDFLRYTDKNDGNKLEHEVFKKLEDPDELTYLKVDALMFHHVYCNIVMLAKSSDLNKSTFDMRKHYLELQLFLEEVEHNPQTALNKEFKVFPSEKRLYGDNKKTNHRLHPMYKPIEDRLFTEDEQDSTLLYPLLTAGVAEMKEKLCTYAKDQLPGGKYWEPEPAVETILRSIKPNNDLCESILGLNDYLVTAIPNMHQMSRSNLIQVKKNKTMQWFHNLPEDQRSFIVHLAVRRRREVMKQIKEEDRVRSRKRRDKLIHEKQRREVLLQRTTKEKEKLATLHLITSSAELCDALSDIDSEDSSAKKKAEKKRTLLRDQINIRKKLLKQKIQIPFTQNRRQRPLREIISELSSFIDENSHEIQTPESLVGKKVLHKFEVEGHEKWFSGYVISYDAQSHLHEVSYEEEEEHFFFNLIEDISVGDLTIIT